MVQSGESACGRSPRRRPAARAGGERQRNRPPKRAINFDTVRSGDGCGFFMAPHGRTIAEAC